MKKSPGRSPFQRWETQTFRNWVEKEDSAKITEKYAMWR